MTARHGIKVTAAHNNALVIAGVLCFADTFVQGGSSVLRMKFSANKPPLRCGQALQINQGQIK